MRIQMTLAALTVIPVGLVGSQGAQTAQGAFIVAGKQFVEVFEDDFNGTGSGLDAAKWDTLIAGTASISRAGGEATIDSGTGADDVYARTKADALNVLSVEDEWAYEIVFTLNESSFPISVSRGDYSLQNQLDSREGRL